MEEKALKEYKKPNRFVQWLKSIFSRNSSKQENTSKETIEVAESELKNVTGGYQDNQVAFEKAKEIQEKQEIFRPEQFKGDNELTTEELDGITAGYQDNEVAQKMAEEKQDKEGAYRTQSFLGEISPSQKAEIEQKTNEILKKYSSKEELSESDLDKEAYDRYHSEK